TRPFRKAVIVVGSHGTRHVSQYESELMTSPLLIVPSAIQVCGLIEFFMKWTEPSPKRVLTPPGCRLREPLKAAPSDDELKHGSICAGWLSQSSPACGGLWPTPV